MCGSTSPNTLFAFTRGRESWSHGDYQHMQPARRQAMRTRRLPHSEQGNSSSGWALINSEIYLPDRSFFSKVSRKRNPDAICQHCNNLPHDLRVTHCSGANSSVPVSLASIRLEDADFGRRILCTGHQVNHLRTEIRNPPQVALPTAARPLATCM